MPLDSGKRRKLTDTETLVFTYLFAQANDASSKNPILGDPYAQQYINKFDHEMYKLSSVHNAEKGNLQMIMRRQRQHDQWVQSFIDRHAASDTPCTVVYLGCALDSRNVRVRRGPSVRWVDVDSVEGISLRRRHMPNPGGDYHMIAADDLLPTMTTTKATTATATTATTNTEIRHHHDSFSWLRAIPADRPTYIVAEMWLAFFRPADSRRLVHRLVEYFGRGQLGIDMMGTVMRDLAATPSPPIALLKGAMPRVRWGVNDPAEISRLHRRLRLRQYLTWWDLGVHVDADANSGYESKAAQQHEDNNNNNNNGRPVTPLFGRWTPLVSRIPGFKKMVKTALYDFGPAPAHGGTAHGAPPPMSSSGGGFAMLKGGKGGRGGEPGEHGGRVSTTSHTWLADDSSSAALSDSERVPSPPRLRRNFVRAATSRGTIGSRRGESPRPWRF